MNWRRFLAVSLRSVGGVLALLCAILFGCEPASPPVVETPPPPVTMSQPIIREVVDEDTYDGRIVAKPKSDIRARVRGHLTAVKFQDGDMVKKGDQLYEIDPGPAKASVDAANAQEKAADAALQFARAEYNRTRSLYGKGASTLEEVESWRAKQAVAQGDLLKAKAAVEEAQLNLGYTQVRAPFDGKLSKTNVELGGLVNAGGSETLLTTLVTVDPIYVEFNVDERSYRRYQESRLRDFKDKASQASLQPPKIPVHVALEGEKGFPHDGVIVFADNQVNPNTGTKLVRGRLSNKNRVLEDGMRARVRVPVSEPHQVTLVIERAIGTDQGKKFLYVVSAENTVERRDVTLGRLRDGMQEIQDGVRPGEWVIVNGIQRVRDGMKVQPQRADMPGVKQFDEANRPKPTAK